MKKFRLLSLLLVVVLMASCFIGCGEDKETNSGVTTFTVWTTNAHSKATYTRLVDEYNATTGKEKGIFIDYQVIEGDSYAKSLELALQTGQGPDFFAGGITTKNAVGNEYIVPINDLPGGEEFLEPYKDYKWDQKNTFNGKTYAVPLTVTTRGLIYNVQMFKDAGLVDENGNPTPPETFEEYREYAKILTDKKNNKFGTIFPMKWSGWIGSDITSMHQSSYGNNGFDPVTGEYDYTGLAPIVEAYMEMIEDGSFYPGADGIDNDQARALFAEGMIGMKMAFSFDVGVLSDQFPAKIEWGVAPLPVVDKNNQYLQPMSVSNSMVITAKAVEEKGGEKVMEVIKFFTSDYFKRELYKDGIDIPFDAKIIEGAELNVDRTGWKEFAEIVNISCIENRLPQTDMTGYLSLDERIKTEVLSGKSNAVSVLKKYNADVTNAAKKYYELNDDDKFENYIDKEWNIKR